MHIFSKSIHGKNISEKEKKWVLLKNDTNVFSNCTVYLQKKETIYGHFLICYLSLFLLRILEIKRFKNKINSYDLINFMLDFSVIIHTLIYQDTASLTKRLKSRANLNN